jgi:pimeloyl-ACP methyl ester carboxylesterase
MNAWLQRMTVLLQALGALLLAWAAAAWMQRARGVGPAGAWLGALLLAAGVMLLLQGLVVGRGFVLARRINRALPAGRQPTAVWIGAWLREWRVSLQVFSWRQPWRTQAEPDFLVPGAGGKRALLLLHGYYCNRALWQPAMRQARSHGVPHLALTLEPAFGSIDAYAGAIAAAVERLYTATGAPLVIVGHSMGGLAVRAWIASLDEAQHQQALSRVERIVTVGTPHRGTALADTFASWPIGANGRQMRRDSDWLRANAERIGPAWRARMACVYSPTDNIVMPYDSALLDGAASLRIDGRGHVELLFAPELGPLWQRAALPTGAAAPGSRPLTDDACR